MAGTVVRRLLLAVRSDMLFALQLATLLLSSLVLLSQGTYKAVITVTSSYLNLAEVQLFYDSTQISSSSLTYSLTSTGSDVSSCFDGVITNYCHSGSDTGGDSLTVSSSTYFNTVVIYNRQDCCQYRICGGSLTVYDGSTLLWTYTFPSVLTMVYRIKSGAEEAVYNGIVMCANALYLNELQIFKDSTEGSFLSYGFADCCYGTGNNALTNCFDGITTSSCYLYNSGGAYLLFSSSSLFNKVVVWSSASSLPGSSLGVYVGSTSIYSGTFGSQATSYIFITAPTTAPTAKPSPRPTGKPSSQPTRQPSSQPSTQPSRQPSRQPSSQPSRQPSSQPSSQPSRQPSSQPSMQPLQPSSQPSSQPSRESSSQPSRQPSSQPSSSPTSRPSRPDLLHSNPLDTKWTKEYVLIKLSAYLFYYFIYFVGQFVILFILDKLNVALSDLYTKLLDSAYRNGVFKPKNDKKMVGGEERKAAAENSISLDNDSIRRLEILDSMLPCDVAVGADTVDEESRRDDASQLSSLYERFGDKKIRYNDAFYRYIEQGRFYFGCDAIVSSARESRLDDFLLYVGCNDHLLSCVFAPKGLRYSKNGRRIVYTLKNSLSFLLLAFVDTFFAFLTTNITAMPYIVKYAIPLCLLVPSSQMFGAIIKKMYTFSSNLRGVSESRRESLKMLGRLGIIPFFLAVAVALILAAMLTYSENKTGIIFEFGVKVHVVAVLVELLQARLQYIQSRHVHIYVKAFGMRLSVFKIGTILCELIHKHRHLEKEYLIWSHSCCCGVFNIDSIARKKEATVEVTGDVEVGERDSVITMQDNPLLQLLGSNQMASAPPPPPPPPPPQSLPPHPVADYEESGGTTPCTAADEGEMQETRTRRVLRDRTDVRIKRKTLENRRLSFVEAFRNMESLIERSVMEAAPRVYEYEYETPADGGSDADAQRILASLRLSDIDSSIAAIEMVGESPQEEPPAEVPSHQAVDARTGIRRGSVAQLTKTFEK